MLVDEKDLWPGGQFVTTHLVVRTEFLEEHPETVEALLRGSSPPPSSSPARAPRPVGRQRPDREAHRQGAQARDDRPAFANLELDPRPGRLVAGREREGRPRGRPAQEGGPRRHLRPEPADELLKAAGKPEVDDAGLGARRRSGPSGTASLSDPTRGTPMTVLDSVLRRSVPDPVPEDGAPAVSVRGLTKRFGAARSSWTTSASTSRRASSSACSAPPAAASRRCSTSSRGSTRRRRAHRGARRRRPR